MDQRTSDQTPQVVSLIADSAPERETDLQDFLAAYPVRFLEAPDRAGILMNATRERVKYARKDLQVVWLIAFSLWNAIRLFAPAVLGPTLFGSSPRSVMQLDEELDGIELDYRQRLASVARVIEQDHADVAYWPSDIPKPVVYRHELSDTQGKVLFDLVTMAHAVLFLHELRHAKFHQDYRDGTPRPSDREEELLCDVYARDWFMSKLGLYAADQRYDFQQVCSKRAMALLVVCEFLRLAKQSVGTLSADLYPPLVVRVSALSGNLPLPETDNYWILSSGVLLAEARRLDVAELDLPSESPKAISGYLLERLSS